jgi:hypothetical protein
MLVIIFFFKHGTPRIYFREYHDHGRFPLGYFLPGDVYAYLPLEISSTSVYRLPEVYLDLDLPFFVSSIHSFPS